MPIMEQTMHLPNFCYDPKTGEPVCQPIQKLEELLEWSPTEHTQHGKATVELQTRTKSPDTPRTLICHDMKGGYLDDRFVNGVKCSDPYRFYHWQYIDSFIYFSHNFITIPPCGWTNAAHTNGVQMLGTLITEWKGGYKRCQRFLKSHEISEKVVDKMVQIAKYYNFEGWLINIENKIEKENVQNLIHFVELLTKKMHSEIPNSIVIWYDSVTIHGNLAWQDQLNELNKAYFDVCDGIFLNYGWKYKGLDSTAKIARDAGRYFDVYVGVDVFGRSKFKAGFEVKEAFEVIKQHKMSMAVFAQGWVYEHLGAENFAENENRFWALLKDYFYSHGPASLPLSTFFCQGFGEKNFTEGKMQDDSAWHNLTKQQLQPTFLNSQFKSTEESSCVRNECIRHFIEDAYNGGGCLELSGTTKSEGICSYKLFLTSIEIAKPVKVSYIYKVTAGKNVDVFLEVQVMQADKRTNLIIKRLTTAEKEDNPSEGYLLEADQSCINGWCKRSAIIRDKSLLGARIVGLNAQVGCTSQCGEPFAVLLGGIQLTEED